MVPSELIFIKIGKGRIPLFAEHGQLVARRLRGSSEGKERGTVTDIPVGSRTTVLELTQEGLTSGFGMRPGKHLRYDRAPILLSNRKWMRPHSDRFLNWHELMNEGHSQVRCIHEK